ncbi:MAG: kynureninase [Halieaceae bacterium]
MISELDVLAMDQADPLASRRAGFALPSDKVYLDGNSLGALPRATPQRLLEVLQEEWGEDLISSWNRHAWIELPQRVGEKIAPLIGAGPGQVICCDSISVNLFKLLAAALQMRPGRQLILSASDNFPTDLYMAQGLSALLGESGCRLQQVAESSLEDSLDEQVAVLLLSHVNFRSGRILDMQRITAAAHAAGALVIWDLAHSAGALPVQLDECDVDFAVGCGYKYLNGGPGAPAYVYAAKHHQAPLQQPLSGWMGHRNPFAFDPHYEPGEGMQQFLCGTPPILSMIALDAALNEFSGLTVAQLRSKSLALGELFVDLVAQSELAAMLVLYSPAEASERGSQLAWSHPQAYGLCQAWIERGVIADFREPDILRVGFAPLYTGFADVWVAVESLRAVFAAQEQLDPRWQQRPRVT